jgi:hypothetical protein
VWENREYEFALQRVGLSVGAVLALLALAGWWYLMLPPKVSRHPLRFSANAPLSQWYFVGLYSSVN